MGVGDEEVSRKIEITTVLAITHRSAAEFRVPVRARAVCEAENAFFFICKINRSVRDGDGRGGVYTYNV